MEWGSSVLIAKEMGRPSYHPTVLLKLYIYGYLNRVQSSRRLESPRACEAALELARRNHF
jgi:hypothetical protein